MKAQKKPVIVDCFVMDWSVAHDIDKWPSWLREAYVPFSEAAGVIQWAYSGERSDRFGNHLVINTLEGPMKVTMGDVIVKGVKGELYPCKRDIFDETFEVVEHGD